MRVKLPHNLLSALLLAAAFAMLAALIGAPMRGAALAPTATPRPSNTPRPTATPRPTQTPRPTATPKPPFPLCDLYPATATPSQSPTPSTPSASSTPIATATATPTAPSQPTPIPLGRRPADAGLTLRDSLLYQQKGLACVEVYDVVPGGPASVAGILPGDLILGIDKTPVGAPGDVVDKLRAYPSGTVVTIVVQRAGRWIALSVTLGLSPYADLSATVEPSLTPTPTRKAA